jgi:NTE family protein
MTSDVTRGRLVRLPWDYPKYGLDADEQLVADAVRASMSIPFFYEPQRFYGRDEQGERVRSFMVDGGMLSNFPIEVSTARTASRPGGPRRLRSTLGEAVHPPTETVRGEGSAGSRESHGGDDDELHDQMHIDDPSVRARTMFVDTQHVKATDFDIDEPSAGHAVHERERGAGKFLSGWDFERYVAEFRTDATIDLTPNNPGSTRAEREGAIVGRAVPGFLPSTPGFRPANDFPHVPVRTIGIPV